MTDDQDDPVDAEITVVDPDDYQKTRKLKALNDAKDHVRSMREGAPETASSQQWEGFHARVAEAVAMYGNELLPLVDDAIEQGLLDEDELLTDNGSVRQFIKQDGRTINPDNGEYVTCRPERYMEFYRHLERLQRKLGLGLELEEQKEPASI